MGLPDYPTFLFNYSLAVIHATEYHDVAAQTITELTVGTGHSSDLGCSADVNYS
jgi:hypothetical protein